MLTSRSDPSSLPENSGEKDRDRDEEIKGTFGISIDRVFALSLSLLTISLVVQIKDITLAISADPIGFPSLPVVKQKGVNDESGKKVTITYSSTLWIPRH